MANSLNPDDPRYACTLAFYPGQKGETGEAIKRLKTIAGEHPKYPDDQSLLREILLRDQRL